MPTAKCLLTLLVVLEVAVCTADTQERIKMCGRDLIRLAVSSCGNSRLRRSLPHVDDSQLDPEVSTEASRTARPTPASRDDGDGFFPAPRWDPVSPRIRRMAGKISDICCEKGCSMQELIQFC